MSKFLKKVEKIIGKVWKKKCIFQKMNNYYFFSNFRKLTKNLKNFLKRFLNFNEK